MKQSCEARVAKEKRAFTVRELVVVVAAVMILAGVFAQAYANVGRKPGLLECKNNLRQVGTAINNYAQEHQDSLPGPLWAGMFHSYAGANSGINGGMPTTWSMGYHLAPYFSLPAPDSTVREVAALKCPASFEARPKNSSSSDPLFQWIAYIACRYVTNTPGAAIPFPNSTADIILSPFGVPGPPEVAPAKLGAIKRASEQWAITDADGSNAPAGGSYYRSLPSSPVHSERPGGQRGPFLRNYLYFDGSVRAVQTPR